MRIFVALVFFTYSVSAQILVLPGDYPDPSVVKIGDKYWATATTSNWAPAYPLLESTDLIHWKTRGAVFPELPQWADYYFWAPEISYENGKVFIYYAAHKRGGNLCLGVASADKPEGPYKDHGPLMCEEAGSIDGFAMRDENGKLFLIWKEDGNSIRQPTPIWAMEINEERTALVGEKKELFRNDASWEANLVEGVSMIRHGDYFYAFYAGAGCCGRECSYAMGVARAKNLLGPWEKYDKNPLFTENEKWKCPGHGTPVEKNGKYYLLYHAYHAKGDVYAGRQGVLKEFAFTDDGWIKLVDNAHLPDVTPANVSEKFNENVISHGWQWSVFSKPEFSVANGRLELTANAEGVGAFVGHRIYTDDYHAEVKMTGNNKVAAGFGLIGDEKNAIVLSVKDKKISIVATQNGKDSVVHVLPNQPQKLQVRMSVKRGNEVTFSYSTDGKSFKTINEKPFDAYFLPPWDRAVRVALFSKGDPSAKAVFDDFVLINH